MLQIGVDFGHASLKVVGLNHGLTGVHFVGSGEAPLPAGAVTTQTLTQTDVLAAALETACKAAAPKPLGKGRVASALPAGAILTKLLELPLMSDKELERAIPLEASQALPVPMEELYLDWIIAPRRQPALRLGLPFQKQPAPNPTVPTEKMTTEVLIIAAPRTLVDGYVAFFEHAGLELISLGVKPAANVRAITATHAPEAYLLIDIGAVDSSIAVVDAGVIRTISTITFGADAFAIVQAGPPPLDEGIANSPSRQRLAEADEQRTGAAKHRSRKIQDSKFKIQKGPKPVKSAGARAVIAGTLLQDKLRPLADEIDHVAKYYEHRITTNGRLNRLRLCGGGAATPGIASALTDLTGLRTDIAEPGAGIHGLPATGNFLRFTTAFGLALDKG